jgi:putative NADH-flavin reductase
MKLTIFGATGHIGSQIVAQALKQGHEVTAFTRTRGKITTSSERLRVVTGDVLDAAAAMEAVQGADAVLCVLGAPLMNKRQLRAKGTKNIISAMESAGVKRLICLSALGVSDSRAALPAYYRYLIFPLILKHVLADHELQENYVKQSTLDWVIVRASNFTKGTLTGSYRHGFATIDRALKLKISHADVADFMLKQLTDDRYLLKTASISY